MVNVVQKLLRMTALTSLCAVGLGAFGACATSTSESSGSAGTARSSERASSGAADDELDTGEAEDVAEDVDQDSEARGLIPAAAQAARDDGNAEYAFSVGTADDKWVEATGVLDTANDRVRVQLGGDKSAPVDDDSGAWFEAIVDKSIAYVRIGGDGRWVRLDGSGIGLSLADLRTRGATSPQALVASLEDAHDDFEKVGTEELRGEQTTHYRGTLSAGRELAETLVDRASEVQAELDNADSESSRDNKTSADAATPNRSERVDRVADALGKGVASDVWLDSEGRPRRIEQSIQWATLLSALDDSTNDNSATSEKDGRVSIGLDLWNYGTAGAVTVPENTVGLVDFLGDLVDDLLGSDEASTVDDLLGSDEASTVDDRLGSDKASTVDDRLGSDKASTVDDLLGSDKASTVKASTSSRSVATSPMQ